MNNIKTARKMSELRDEPAAKGKDSERLDWQPIETAPKDGWYLLFMGWRGVRLGRRSEDKEYAWEFFETFSGKGMIQMWLNAIGSTNECAPTHWMPLPKPPAMAGEGDAS